MLYLVPVLIGACTPMLCPMQGRSAIGASRSVSSVSTGSIASLRHAAPLAPGRHSSSSTILIDQDLFDFDAFGLMATGKQTPPLPEMREGSISPGTPEWESMQAPGAVKVQKALAKWEDGCSATVTVRPVPPWHPR